MDGDRIGYSGRRPTGSPDLEGEIEVLEVEENAFVEPADLLPCRAAIPAARSGRPGKHRFTRVGFGHGSSAETGKAGERSVRRQTDGIDRQFPGLDEKGRCRAELRILLERPHESLEKVGARLDVVVQQDDHLTSPRSGAAVAGDRETEIL